MRLYCSQKLLYINYVIILLHIIFKAGYFWCHSVDQ